MARSGSRSADDERGMLALSFAQAAGFHPVIGAAEQRRIIIVDMLVADEGPEKLMRSERALGMGGDMVRIFVEVGIDQIDRHVLGVVISLAPVGCEIGRDDLAAAIERGRDDMRALLETKTD